MRKIFPTVDEVQLLDDDALLVRYRGAWATGENYVVGDLALNSGAWMCKADHPASATNEPGVGANYADYWEPLQHVAVSEATHFKAEDTIPYLRMKTSASKDILIRMNGSVLEFYDNVAGVVRASINMDTGVFNSGSTELITDSTAWTPTGSWLVNAIYTGFWRKIGDRAYYEVKIALTGAPTSAYLSIDLPSGHVIDTAKLLDTTTLGQTLGIGTIHDVSAPAIFHAFVKYNDNNTVNVYLGQVATYLKTDTGVTQAVPMTFANGDFVVLKFDVPIVGW